MIDFDRERILTFAEAAQRLRVHKVTVHRWHLKGVNGVKLETRMVGGVRRTSVEAIDRFQDAVDAKRAAQEDEPQPRDARTRRSEESRAELAAAGICS